jgi:hypothetical protein
MAVKGVNPVESLSAAILPIDNVLILYGISLWLNGELQEKGRGERCENASIKRVKEGLMLPPSTGKRFVLRWGKI